jgi:putative radical SAM enzyme (TIGR03279 family)
VERHERRGAIVTGVLPGSIAAEAGIEVGDRLLAINGAEPEDIIDYRYLTSEENVLLRVRKTDGDVWEIQVEKEGDVGLGLEFESATFTPMRRCANRCIFCFIDQNPPALRPSLYVYDDDYRLSFLYGQFITLTNLRRCDWERIAKLKLSPLYVSVHALDPQVRARLLGTARGADIRPHLAFFAEHGLQIHAQIVLCPGVNDGRHLADTVHGLAAYHPTVLSTAIVPVGLTRHRAGLTPLRPVSRREAAELVETVASWQEQLLAALGTRFVWAADEFYVAHELPLPPRAAYEDLPQTENGVGITRLFVDEFRAALQAATGRTHRSGRRDIVTSVLGAQVLKPLVAELQALGAQVRLQPVRNHFFGETITAAGLLTARDIIAQLRCTELGDELLLPEAAVRRRDPVPMFLDGATLPECEAALGVPVRVLDGAAALVEHLLP